MSAPIVSLATEAAKAGKYPGQFNKREAKMLESVQDYVDNVELATANIADDAVTKAKLAPGIDFSHRVFAAGNFTTLGGDTAEAITVTGALATDIAMVTLKTPGASPVTVIASAAATNAINVTMSADPSTDHVLSYMLLRAAT